jgi:hypothetical protein
MRNFLPYNKEVLFSVIDRISITKEGDQVVTKYGNRVSKLQMFLTDMRYLILLNI